MDIDKAHAIKEQAYKDKERISRKIADLIEQVDVLKKKRNSFTKLAKGYKRERSDLNKKIKDKINRFKELHKKTKELGIDFKKVDPVRLKKEIENLEYKMQTEVMSFKKEKELMRTIESKREQLPDQHSELLSEMRTLDKEIGALKRESNNVHGKVQENAETSQRYHERMIETSKEIDTLKKQEEQAYEQFMEAKKDYLVLSRKTQKKSTSHKERKCKSRKVHKQLKKKKIAVDEKIKKKMKLTTEDLLSYQKSEDISLSELLKE